MSIKRMQTISYIWGSILVLLVGGLTAIGFVYKNKITKYEDLESKLELSLKEYVDKKFLYPKNGESIKVTYEELKSNEAIDGLNIDDEECDGYGFVKNDGSVFKYKVYVKCNGYKTKGYDKN